MNYFNPAILLFASLATAQYFTDQVANQVENVSSYIGQNGENIQATVSSFVEAQDYRTQIPQSVRMRFSDYRDQRMEVMASASSYFAQQGYVSTVPADVRQSYISSLMVAKSTQIIERINSVSAYMATQTEINTASLSAAISSYAATASIKPQKKALLKLRKETKAKNNSDINATSTATSAGFSNGFKNFFKSLQLKIQKTSSTSSSEIAPTATS